MQGAQRVMLRLASQMEVPVTGRSRLENYGGLFPGRGRPTARWIRLRNEIVGSVQQSGRCVVLQLAYGVGDPAPDRGAVVIVVSDEFISSRCAFVEGFLAVQFGRTPDVDLGYHEKLRPCGRQRFNTHNCIGWKPACQGGGDGTDIARRGCRQRHWRGVCLCRRAWGHEDPAGAGGNDVRQYGEQFRVSRRQRRPRLPKPPRLL